MHWLLVILVAAAQVHHKPTAPVVVELSQRSLGGADYEITLTARPTRDVDALELSVDGRRKQVGRARAKSTYTMTVRVRQAGAGRKVIGAAAVRVDGRRRSIANEITIGSEPAAARLPAKIIVMPDGTRVEEVRP